MMRETIVALLLTTLLVIFPFMGGLLVADVREKQKLSQCAKKHNVYACEFIAVPVKEGE